MSFFAPVLETLTLASALSTSLTACEERYCWRGVGVWADLALIRLWNGKSQEASRLLIFLTCHVCCKNSERCKKPCASRPSSRKENGQNIKTCSHAAAESLSLWTFIGILSQPSSIWLPAYYLSSHLLHLGAATAAGISLCMLNTSP